MPDDGKCSGENESKERGLGLLGVALHSWVAEKASPCLRGCELRHEGGEGKGHAEISGTASPVGRI